MAINSTSFTRTPQAGDDWYYWNEDDLLSSNLYNADTNVLTLDVMSNDLGGKAKVLYSIDDGNGNAIPYDLLSQDALNGVSAWEATAGGNLMRINNGKIELDVSHDLPGGIDSLAAGKEFTDDFVYAIRLGNGTLSWAHVHVTVVGSNDAPTDLALGNTSVDENAAGAVIGAITVTDPDIGDTFTFTVDDSRFEVVGGNLKLKAEFSLDYETEQSVSVKVTVTDAGGLSYNETFAIAVNDLNLAPVITSGSIGSIAENAPIATVAYDANATDDGENTGTLFYTLSGADAALFDIDADDGEVRFKASPNFEAPADADADNVYEVVVHANDGSLDTTKAVSISVTDVNLAPVITSGATGSIAENAAIATVAYDASATDDGENNGTLTYALSGTDAALFDIDADDGEVRFKASPNFEAPADADADNVYDIVVHANDGSLDTTKAVAITVTDVNLAPVITSGSTGSIAENAAIATVAYDANATDDGENTGTLFYTLSGTDAALFDIDADDGEVRFKASPNFEAPADADADNVYDIVVHADDGSLDSTKAVSITVTDVNAAPLITSGSTGTIAENAAIATVAYDTNATDDGENTGNLTYSLSGTDAALFTIDGDDGEVHFKASPNFEAPPDADADNVYEVVVHANDGSLDTTKAVSITVTDVNAAPLITSGSTGTIAENAAIATVAYDASATDDGENTGTLFYALSGTDAALFTIDADDGEVRFKTSPNFEAPADVGGNNTYDIIVHANDGALDTTKAVAIAVTDLAEGDPNDFDDKTGGATTATNGNDFMVLTSGADTIDAQQGNDEIYGKAGSDNLQGNLGNDTIYGGSGDDTIQGNGGSDLLFGGSGADTISGNTQDDVIIGGYGADSINGGGGSDTFRYLSVLDAGDIISGFDNAGSPGGDVIDLSAITTAFSNTTATANSAWYQVSGSDSIVFVDTTGDTTADFSITLKNVSSLIAADFDLTP